MELLEKAVRLALSDKRINVTLAHSKGSDYENDKAEDTEKEEEEAPEMMWNGPAPKNTLPFGGGGGGGGFVPGRVALGH